MTRSLALLLALAACQAMTNSAPPPEFDAAWNYQDPAGTEERFRAIEAAVPDAPLGWRVELRTQIARTYSLRAEFEAAHATLDAVADDLDAAGPVARSRYLLERGRTHNSAGEKGRATELFREAFDVASAAGAERFAADALHMLGISTPPDEALAWNERAIAYCESCTDEKARRWLGPLLHNTWYTHLEKGKLDVALGYAEKSRAFRESIGDVAGERIGRWTIAHTLRKQGRVADALARLEALAADYGTNEGGEVGEGGVEGGDPSGYTQEELGECLLALDRAAEARPHFAAAYAILKDDVWLLRDEAARLERLRGLAGPAP